jgi:hypothetical protein
MAREARHAAYCFFEIFDIIEIIDPEAVEECFVKAACHTLSEMDATGSPVSELLRNSTCEMPALPPEHHT